MGFFDGVTVYPLSWARGYRVTWLGDGVGTILVSWDDRNGSTFAAYPPPHVTHQQPDIFTTLNEAVYALMQDASRRPA